MYFEDDTNNKVGPLPPAMIIDSQAELEGEPA